MYNGAIFEYFAFGDVPNSGNSEANIFISYDTPYTNSQTLSKGG